MWSKGHCKKAVSDGVTIRDSIGREQKPVIIPESDLYRLIMRSNLEEAETFQDWIVDDERSRFNLGRQKGVHSMDTPIGIQKKGVIDEPGL